MSDHALKCLEAQLKMREQELVSTQVELKEAKELVETKQEDIGFIITDIKSLKDALHKLKGLDNLEKKSKIADSAEMSEHQFLRKGPHRTQLKWKDVEDMEIRRFIKDFLLPEITQLLMDRQYSFHEKLKEALK